MARPAVVLLALAGALLFLPVALGQSTSPTTSISVSLPKGPDTVPLGGNGSVAGTVTLTIQGFVCPQAQLPSGAIAGQATVKLSVADQPSPVPGITSTISPASVTFNITQANYVNAPFSGSAPFTVKFAVAAGTIADHDHALNVTALYDQGTPTNCQPFPPSGSVPSASAHGEHDLHTGPAAALGGSSGPGGVSTSAAKKSGAGLPVLAAVVVALLARRRLF
ncbi:MAG: hypothetical protein ACYDBQ_12565 [Thermoplasmatota archaeon]